MTKLEHLTKCVPGYRNKREVVGVLRNFEKSERLLGLLRAARGAAVWSHTGAKSRPCLRNLPIRILG